jgi:hypothetical protein
MHTILTNQMTEVESVDDQCIDSTIYIVGTTVNQTFLTPYSDLTAPQKAVVDAYRALIISLAPAE